MKDKSFFKENDGMYIRPRLLPASAWPGHIPFAAWLMHAIRPKIFVELGTYRGASYFSICQAVHEAQLDTKCYAVDLWSGDEHTGTYGEDIFACVEQHHQENYASFSHLMRMSFDEASRAFDPGSVDILHIDGLHTYEAVKHDFETWLPKMATNGVVMFHDTMVRGADFGVWKFWEEISERYPAFEFTHSHGLGVIQIGCDESPLDPLTGASELGKSLLRRKFEYLGDLVSARFTMSQLRKEIFDHCNHINVLQASQLRNSELISQLRGDVERADEKYKQSEKSALVKASEIESLKEDSTNLGASLSAVVLDRDALQERLKHADANTSRLEASLEDERAANESMRSLYSELESRVALDNSQWVRQFFKRMLGASRNDRAV